ncbi:hypothetical protein TIFTF001_001228 [Ficus carica]|uniref:Uncharacterized protein n=1 Tax=Ficus carica TaxID=3494 RepID=A0AA87Z681_FICCA|nr:hypothetical protein TIFTF001_001228 [Ficus carica]
MLSRSLSFFPLVFPVCHKDIKFSTPICQYYRYYCFLVPVTLPVLVVAVYFHWLSMKLFKHA